MTLQWFVSVCVFGVVVKAKAQKGPEVGWFNIEFYSNVI